MYLQSLLKIEFKVHVMSADCECKNQIRDKMKTQFRACQQVKKRKRKGKHAALTDETMEALKLNSGALSSSTDLTMQQTQSCLLAAGYKSSCSVLFINLYIFYINICRFWKKSGFVIKHSVVTATPTHTKMSCGCYMIHSKFRVHLMQH